MTGQADDLPICVDLDGTLVRSDTLVEGLLQLGLGLVGAALVLRSSGRAALKAHVARAAPLDAARLPYDERLVAWLRARKAEGARLVLSTAADARVAGAVAAHLGLFDEVMSSDGTRNNKGAEKAASLAGRFGRGGYIYAGNDREDLPAWAASGGVITVNASEAVRAQAVRLAPVHADFPPLPVLRPALRALRPHQWVKNLLVFVPIFTAHALTQGAAWLGAIGMFVAFCLTASGIYLVNDLLDLQADRAHPRKRRRALASGALPLLTGAAMAPSLVLLGFGIGVAAGAGMVVLLYAAMSLAYSLILKQKPLVDVLMLAGLYTIRLFGGGEATGHRLSLWLLAFSSFLFLGLAIVKRVGELREADRHDPGMVPRRGYSAGDAAIMQQFGICASFASCIVLALYVQSEAATGPYGAPELLWFVVPLILFWQMRLWLATERGYMHDDPIIYAARDWVSWVVGACTLGVLLGATSGVFAVR